FVQRSPPIIFNLVFNLVFKGGIRYYIQVVRAAMPRKFTAKYRKFTAKYRKFTADSTVYPTITHKTSGRSLFS
ncbi:MAG: hypothetical protein N0E56_16815, partial [Candidatus Thiodiazotropha endolucinida]|nr:hypothetical protein [Candidatus Thiodiazotropha taylori]MCW4268287.1 hypothetical protein [Candidatus Thiodiazotropha endolucinida]